MKALLNSTLALLLIVVASCNQRNYSFETRKYRPGFYAHQAKKDHSSQTSIAKVTDVSIIESKTEAEDRISEETKDVLEVVNISEENAASPNSTLGLDPVAKSKKVQNHTPLPSLNFSDLSFQNAGSAIKSLQAVRKEMKKEQQKYEELDTYEILRIVYYVVLGLAFALLLTGAIFIARLNNTPLGLILLLSGLACGIASAVIFVIARAMY